MPTVLTLRTAGRVLLGLSAAVLLGGGLAIAQMLPDANPGPQVVRNLNLSRDQVQQLQSVMEDYKSSFEAVLTEDQLEELEALRAEQTNPPDQGVPQDWLAQLNLSDSQSSELSALREVMMAEFEAIFTAEQLEQLQSIGLFDRL